MANTDGSDPGVMKLGAIDVCAPAQLIEDVEMASRFCKHSALLLGTKLPDHGHAVASMWAS